MSRYTQDAPPFGHFHYIPRGKANCKAFEIINADGQTIRNFIGYGWTASPLESPIISETILGTIEIVNLPSINEDDEGGGYPMAGGSLAQPPAMTNENAYAIH